MTVLATDTPRYSNLVKTELWPEKGFCRLSVTCLEGSAKTYKVGTVLGKITASGKYKICVQTAVDGSQTAAAIVLEDKSVSASTDTKVLVMVRGPAMVSKSALDLDASHDLDAEKTAIYDALEAKNILVDTTV